jgi:hypothetical protein
VGQSIPDAGGSQPLFSRPQAAPVKMKDEDKAGGLNKPYERLNKSYNLLNRNQQQNSSFFGLIATPIIHELHLNLISVAGRGFSPFLIHIFFS